MQKKKTRLKKMEASKTSLIWRRIKILRQSKKKTLCYHFVTNKSEVPLACVSDMASMDCRHIPSV